MSAAPQRLQTVDDVLARAPERDGKWELRDGVAVCVAPERLAHVQTKSAAAIRRAEAPCDGLGVRISARTMYIPDALVYCGPRLSPDAREISFPVIVVEALSSSTAGNDPVDRLAYFTLPSVMHYLVLNPDTRRGVHHKRGQGGAAETRILRDGAPRPDPPGIGSDAAEVFGPAE